MALRLSLPGPRGGLTRGKTRVPGWRRGPVQNLNWRRGQFQTEGANAPSELRLLLSPACACWGRRASGGSGGCPGGRGSPGTSGRRTSPARGSCGFWRTTGGSRCGTCCTRSWLGRRRASCRNTSPGPRSRHLGAEDTGVGPGTGRSRATATEGDQRPRT